MTTPMFWLLLCSAYTEPRSAAVHCSAGGGNRAACHAFCTPHHSFSFLLCSIKLSLSQAIRLPFFPSILSPIPVRAEGAKCWEVLS